MGNSWGLELSYLGSKTIREPQFMDMNAPDLPVGPLANLSLQQRRRFPQWGTLGTWNPIGWNKYNALIASIKNNQWHGLTLLANYSFAKNIASAYWASSDQGNTNFRYPYIWAGPYMSTPRHRLVAGYTYLLPFGRNRGSAGSPLRVLNQAISGWVVGGISTFSTGSPDWVQGRDLSGTGLSPAMPDRICDAMQDAPRTRLAWFNRGCFVDAQFGHYGNSPLGVVTNPGVNNWSLNLSKFIKTQLPDESAGLAIRLELKNAFNHTQWGGVNTNMASGNFGRITNTRPPRQIQIALKYQY
jgi:hypothetical protein